MKLIFFGTSNDRPSCFGSPFRKHEIAAVSYYAGLESGQKPNFNRKPCFGFG